LIRSGRDEGKPIGQERDVNVRLPATVGFWTLDPASGSMASVYDDVERVVSGK
jgi:hypothetical protein